MCGEYAGCDRTFHSCCNPAFSTTLATNSRALRCKRTTLRLLNAIARLFSPIHRLICSIKVTKRLQQQQFHSLHHYTLLIAPSAHQHFMAMNIWFRDGCPRLTHDFLRLGMPQQTHLSSSVSPPSCLASNGRNDTFSQFVWQPFSVVLDLFHRI